MKIFIENFRKKLSFFLKNIVNKKKLETTMKKLREKYFWQFDDDIKRNMKFNNQRMKNYKLTIILHLCYENLMRLSNYDTIKTNIQLKFEKKIFSKNTKLSEFDLTNVIFFTFEFLSIKLNLKKYFKIHAFLKNLQTALSSNRWKKIFVKFKKKIFSIIKIDAFFISKWMSLKYRNFLSAQSAKNISKNNNFFRFK